MKVVFENQKTIDIELNDSAAASSYAKINKHLQHVPLPFRPWDNTYYFHDLELETLVDQLCQFGNEVNIIVDKTRCLQKDQGYFNHLHKLYEDSYNGHSAWLDYHEHIHFCEAHPNTCPQMPISFLALDYREKSGLLEKSVDPSWFDLLQTHVDAGDVFVVWAELGKSPYGYWSDHEPDNLDRICELVKPWLRFRPKLCVALESGSLVADKNRQDFEKWWAQYHDDWCQYWKIPSWSLDQMYGVSVIGKVADFDLLVQQLQQGHRPQWIKP